MDGVFESRTSRSESLFPLAFLDHDWGPRGTLGLVSNPAIGLGDGSVVSEGVLGIILVLLETMFSGRITSGGT